jgi:hypothetical protein
MEADRIDHACSYWKGLENVLIKAQASNSARRDGASFLMESLQDVLGLLGQCEELRALSGVRLQVAKHGGSDCFLACNCNAS